MSEEASLYIIGGFSHLDKSRQTSVYKLSDWGVSWQKYGLNFQYPWSFAGSIVIGQDIYAMGGKVWKDYNWLDVQYAAVYKTDQRRWEIITNITYPRPHRPTLFHLGSKLYVTGGSPQLSMQSLDLNIMNAVWEDENVDLPFKVTHSNAVTINNNVYICGGLSNEYQRSVITWTPGMASWTFLRDMHHSRQWHCTLTDSDHSIWVVGGCNQDECNTIGFVELYSITTNSWKQLNSSPDTAYTRVNFCTLWKEFIYVTFYTWTQNSNSEKVLDIEPFFHIYNTLSGEWKVSPPQLTTLVVDSVTAVVP